MPVLTGDGYWAVNYRRYIRTHYSSSKVCYLAQLTIAYDTSHLTGNYIARSVILDPLCQRGSNESVISIKANISPHYNRREIPLNYATVGASIVKLNVEVQFTNPLILLLTTNVVLACSPPGR